MPNATHVPQPSLHPYTVVLLDIEGTTTPISFVHDVLFPYARRNLEDFFIKTWGSDECDTLVNDLREQVGSPLAIPSCNPPMMAHLSPE